MELAMLGMGFIVLAWLVQFVSVWETEKNELKGGFLGLYALGVIFLVLDGINKSDFTTAGFNIIIVILSGMVLVRTKPYPSRKKMIATSRIQAGILILLAALLLFFVPLFYLHNLT